MEWKTKSLKMQKNLKFHDEIDRFDVFPDKKRRDLQCA